MLQSQTVRGHLVWHGHLADDHTEAEKPTEWRGQSGVIGKPWTWGQPDLTINSSSDAS